MEGLGPWAAWERQVEAGWAAWEAWERQLEAGWAAWEACQDQWDAWACSLVQLGSRAASCQVRFPKLLDASRPLGGVVV